MRKYQIGAILTAYYEIPATSMENAREWAYNSFPKETEFDLEDGTPVRVHFLVDDVHTINARGIMDTSNGHNADLVRRINNAYDKKKDTFTDIASLLIHRDLCEFESVADREPSGIENDIICYCMNVADNKDLEIILNYCRM